MLVLPSGSILHPETLGGLLPLEIKFHVSEYLKGSGDSTLLLYRPTYRVVDDNGQIVQVLPYTDCDYFNPKLGDQYLLFMQKTDPLRYEAGIAQRISPDYDVSGFIADVRAAIVRRAGLPGAGVEPAAQHSSPPPAVLLAFGAGLLASGAFLAVTRRRN